MWFCFPYLVCVVISWAALIHCRKWHVIRRLSVESGDGLGAGDATISVLSECYACLNKHILTFSEMQPFLREGDLIKFRGGGGARLGNRWILSENTSERNHLGEGYINFTSAVWRNLRDSQVFCIYQLCKKTSVKSVLYFEDSWAKYLPMASIRPSSYPTTFLSMGPSIHQY